MKRAFIPLMVVLALAAVFWPLDRQHREETAQRGDCLVKLIEGYARDHDTLTDVHARSPIDELFAMQKEDGKIKAAWAEKLEKVLPAKLVARFVQIESKLDPIVRMELAEGIPRVEPRPKG